MLYVLQYFNIMYQKNEASPEYTLHDFYVQSIQGLIKNFEKAIGEC